MILVIGGAFQGKTEFAKMQFQGRVIAYQYHEQVKKEMLEGKDVCSCAKEYLENYKDAVIVMDEVGAGITPMQSEDRRFRELVGAVGCYFAKHAEEVYRVFAGVAVRIK